MKIVPLVSKIKLIKQHSSRTNLFCRDDRYFIQICCQQYRSVETPNRGLIALHSYIVFERSPFLLSVQGPLTQFPSAAEVRNKYFPATPRTCSCNALLSTGTTSLHPYPQPWKELHILKSSTCSVRERPQKLFTLNAFIQTLRGLPLDMPPVTCTL